MKNIYEIKNVIKTICSKDDAVMVDHDLNVSILDSLLKSKLNELVYNMTFAELNRVVGYFIEELEGDGLNLVCDKMDDPYTYLAFCMEECEQTLEDTRDYVENFRLINLRS